MRTTDWMVETQLFKLYPYIRHAPWACSFYILFIIWCFWTKPAWLVILSFTNFMDGRSRVFYIFNPREGYRSVTPLNATRVNGAIFHNHSVHWYHITRVEGGDYRKHDFATIDKQVIVIIVDVTLPNHPPLQVIKQRLKPWNSLSASFTFLLYSSLLLIAKRLDRLFTVVFSGHNWLQGLACSWQIITCVNDDFRNMAQLWIFIPIISSFQLCSSFYSVLADFLLCPLLWPLSFSTLFPFCYRFSFGIPFQYVSVFFLFPRFPPVLFISYISCWPFYTFYARAYIAFRSCIVHASMPTRTGSFNTAIVSLPQCPSTIVNHKYPTFLLESSSQHPSSGHFWTNLSSRKSFLPLLVVDIRSPRHCHQYSSPVLVPPPSRLTVP